MGDWYVLQQFVSRHLSLIGNTVVDLIHDMTYLLGGFSLAVRLVRTTVVVTSHLSLISNNVDMIQHMYALRYRGISPTEPP